MLSQQSAQQTVWEVRDTSKTVGEKMNGDHPGGWGLPVEMGGREVTEGVNAAVTVKPFMEQMHSVKGSCHCQAG